MLLILMQVQTLMRWSGASMLVHLPQLQPCSLAAMVGTRVALLVRHIPRLTLQPRKSSLHCSLGGDGRARGIGRGSGRGRAHVYA